jgi:uncharacterized protein YbbK (DUF523 family)
LVFNASKHSPKILISACLLGENVRYDGGNNFQNHSFLKQDIFIPICPEVSGGLSTPRIPAEIKEDRVINQEGDEVTAAFRKGASDALFIAKRHHIKIAILKDKSPSCGNHNVYDGTFSKTLIAKMGVTTALLSEHGISVFNENEIDEAMLAYSKMASK